MTGEPSSPPLLCLDLGTSAAKAALVDCDGRTRAAATRAYPTATTPDGGAEQDPGDWLRATREAIGEVSAAADTAPPSALAITGQMQDLILLPAPSTPQTPAILYSDSRAVIEAEEIHALLAGQGADWDALTGNQQDATSCAAMHRRLRRADPATVERSRGLVFGPAGFLADAVGLGAWCDPTTASTTGLLDAGTRRWSPAVARAAGIPQEHLPRLTSGSAQTIGRTDARAQDLLGLPAGIPVVLVAGDAGATTAGIVGLAAGEAYAYMGTSGWVASVVADAPADAARHSVDVSHRLLLEADGSGRRSLRISALLAAGAAASWAREAFLGGASTSQADGLLEQREAECGRGPTGLLALPSIHGERYPVRDAELRAAVLGMDATTRGPDVYAAVLEGVAHAIGHALAGVDGADGGEGADGGAGVLAVTGGGAASAPWRRILADVTGRQVRAVPEADAALLGTALLAAEALGLPHRIRPLAEQARSGGVVVEPEARAVQGHARMRAAHRALYGAAADVMAMVPTGE